MPLLALPTPKKRKRSQPFAVLLIEAFYGVKHAALMARL